MAGVGARGRGRGRRDWQVTGKNKILKSKQFFSWEEQLALLKNFKILLSALKSVFYPGSERFRLLRKMTILLRYGPWSHELDDIRGMEEASVPFTWTHFPPNSSSVHTACSVDIPRPRGCHSQNATTFPAPCQEQTALESWPTVLRKAGQALAGIPGPWWSGVPCQPLRCEHSWCCLSWSSCTFSSLADGSRTSRPAGWKPCLLQHRPSATQDGRSSLASIAMILHCWQPAASMSDSKFHGWGSGHATPKMWRLVAHWTF